MESYQILKLASLVPPAPDELGPDGLTLDVDRVRVLWYRNGRQLAVGLNIFIEQYQKVLVIKRAALDRLQ